jgi:hypothetical protein
MRFVPFATEAGSPAKIRIGSVRNEPPPAITFKTPAIAPDAKSKSPIIQSCIGIPVPLERIGAPVRRPASSRRPGS